MQPVAWGFFNTYWQPTLHYKGTLFYIMTVASHFLSAFLTYKTLICNECVCCVWHMSVSPRIIFLTPSLIMVNTHLMLTAMHWTKMLGLHLMAKWNMGKDCAACNHMKFFSSASQPIVGSYSQPFSGLYPPLLRFLDHTQQRATVGRTPLDEWSVRCRDLYLTTLTTDKHPCPQWGNHMKWSE